MNHDDIQNIKSHFNREGKGRDLYFLTDPILSYEKAACHRSINALFDSSYCLVLDAGCGDGHEFSLLLARSKRVIACDFSEIMLQGARKVIDIMPLETKERMILDQASLTDLPYEENTFDLVLCSEVLEHIPNWTEALKEFYRVLKPNGHLIISTPNKWSMYGFTRYSGRLIFGSKHAYDKWKSYWEHRSALKNAGFQLIESRGANYLIGDLCYFQPTRFLITRMLPVFKWAEQFLSRISPFKFFGYTIVVKAQKPATIEI